MTIRALAVFAFFALVSVLGMSSSASAASCRDGQPFTAGTTVTITIMPCPAGNSAVYVAGVPGQNELIAHGLIALQGKGKPGCLWVKTIKKNNGTYTLKTKKVTTDLVALPSNGVLRLKGGIVFKSDARIAGIELVPGACAGKTVAVTVAEAIALK